MNTSPVPIAFYAKFSKICGLFSSPHDGERAMAAKLAHKMLERAGLSWGELLRPPQRTPPPPPPRESRHDWFMSDAEKINFAFDRLHRLSRWEQGFITSLEARRWHRLTHKQKAVLDRIIRSLGIY